MIKNALYFMWRALFVLEVFTFLSCLFGYVEKRLEKKLRLISQFMTSLTGQQIIKIHIFPNISTSKDNQTMKVGHLIEYKMRNIFLEKWFTKCGGKTRPSPFYKKSKLNISLDQQPETLQSLFLLYVQTEVYQQILKLKGWPRAFTLYRAFLKNENGSGTSLPASFFAWFLKKKTFHIIFY